MKQLARFMGQRYASKATMTLDALKTGTSGKSVILEEVVKEVTNDIHWRLFRFQYFLAIN